MCRAGPVGLFLTLGACGQDTDSQGQGGNLTDAALDGSVTSDAADAGPCVPRSCVELGLGCGRGLDGCGGTLDCGTCPDGETCGAGGPNLCGVGTCVRKTCFDLGASCGPISDGCDDVLDCGGCPVPQSCGGGGVPNVCGCRARSCAELGASCGTVPDGCKDVVWCGDCPLGKTCGAGGPNLCGEGTCTPRTCAQLTASCGYVSDGCAEALDCGSCEPPDVCGGSGLLNTCGCLPSTCDQLGADCGQISDGCGSILSCGSCSPPLQCGAGGIPNRCAKPTPNDGGPGDGGTTADCTEPGALVDPSTGHCYFPSPAGSGTWQDQALACESAGAHLVTITTMHEADFLQGFYDNGGDWIGLSRMGSDEFTWVTDEPFDFERWKTAEPNGYGDSCVLVRTKDGVWSDQPCDLLHTALCERP